jgi:hypothetical protein
VSQSLSEPIPVQFHYVFTILGHIMMPAKWSDEAGFLLFEAVDGRELARSEQHGVTKGGAAWEDRKNATILL